MLSFLSLHQLSKLNLSLRLLQSDQHQLIQFQKSIHPYFNLYGNCVNHKYFMWNLSSTMSEEINFMSRIWEKQEFLFPNFWR